MKPTKKTNTLSTRDFSALVLARKILKQSPKANLEIYVKALENTIEYKDIPENNATLGIRHIYDSSLLVAFGNEGQSDSIEFRRIARKIFRKIKQSQEKELFITDLILCEEKTKKILRHIAGSNLKLEFIDDFYEIPEINETEKRSIQIKTGDTPLFTHEITEKILKEKISLNIIKEIPTNQ